MGEGIFNAPQVHVSYGYFLFSVNAEIPGSHEYPLIPEKFNREMCVKKGYSGIFIAALALRRAGAGAQCPAEEENS